MKLVFALLALVLLRWIITFRVYSSVSAGELKRRARLDDSRAKSLYRVAVYKPALDVIFWALTTAAASTLIIWSVRTDWWLGVVALTIIAWLSVWGKFPADGWAGRLAVWFVPIDALAAELLSPVLSPTVKLFPRPAAAHTGLYEKRDLLELLKKQGRESDNRIPEGDLKIAGAALSFGDKKVSNVMTPRAKIKYVKAGETVGPTLMDELHKTGLSRFPVVKDNPKAAAPKVIGTLYLSDVIGDQSGGKVKDFIHINIFYINEDADLRLALEAFLESNQLMLIVINNFDETVGILNLEDVLAEIVGRPTDQSVAN